MDLEFEASIKKVSVSAKTEKSQVIRKMRVTLESEFNPLVAKAIGDGAMEILEQIRAAAAEKVVMPIDAVIARLELNVAAVGAGKTDSVIVGRAAGRKATASWSKSPDVNPTVALEFEFMFTQEAWGWFGRNAGGFATVEIKPAQLTLAKKAS